ncbi:MAG: hypothetical protein LBS35_03460 [Synergistaceae bacterium]|nr:hypothetical protein [Synergistaceae bacterium]
MINPVANQPAPKTHKFIALMRALSLSILFACAFTPSAFATSGGVVIDLADASPPASGMGWT